MICYADYSHYDQILELWNIAFGEDKAFNNYYFENLFSLENTLVYLIEDNVAAMTQAIEYEITGLGKVSYIYGATTHPHYRRRGLMTTLLEESFNIDKKAGRKASMLIPANKSLFDFYARLGYKTAFYTETLTLPAKASELKKVELNDTELLNKIYERELSDIPHPVRTPEYWAEQIKMFNALGGYVYRTDNSYAFGWNNEIQEIIGNDFSLLGGSIAVKLGLNEIKATTIGKNNPLGMFKPYTTAPDEMYFNLLFN